RWGRERSYTSGFEGAVDFIKRKHDETESEWSRERYEGYMREVPCPVCLGARLKPEVLAVRIGELNIAQLSDMSIAEAKAYLDNLHLGTRESAIAGQVLKEIHAR